MCKYPNSKEILGRILELISGKGLTDKQFCENLGLGIKTVDNWKRGVSESYMKKLSVIASYFEVSIDYLLGNTDIKKGPTTASDELLSKEEYELIHNFRKLTIEERRFIVNAVEQNAKLKN